MSKEIFFSEQARDKLKKGVDKLANAVRTTLGPRGKVAVFERGDVIFSLDGVTVAKQIQLRDHGEQMGVQLVQKIASKTDKEAGDGTSTATILAQAILSQGLRALTTGGIDRAKMKEGMQSAKDLAVKTIKKMAKPVKEIADVATISSRDPEVGKMVADIVKKLGKEATIDVQEDNIMGMHVEKAGGMMIEQGYIAPYFITNEERGEAVLEEPYVLVSSQVVMSNQDIVKVLSEIYKSEKRALLFIADDIKGEALATMVLNKMHGKMLCVAIKAPGFGDDKQEQLKDIAVVTGATFISEETGEKVEDVNFEKLGKAKRVIVKQDETIIVGGAGKKKDIFARISFLQNRIKKEKSDYERELMEKRLAKLKGGVAVIKVGTPSEQETMEKRYRIEDAVKAVKSAIEEGIVPGAGMCLMSCADAIQFELMNDEKDLSRRLGLEIVYEALSEPARQIILNAGYKPDVILEQVSGDWGFDSATGKYCMLTKGGIVDPAKVVRCGLENAMSIVSLFLITETLIVSEQPKDEKKND